MQKILNKLRMKQKIVLLSVAGIILTAFVLWSLFYSVMQNMFEKKITHITAETVTQVSNYVNNELTHVLQLVHGGLIGYNTAEMLRQVGAAKEKNPLLRAHIEQMLTQFEIQNQFIESAHVVVGNMVISNLNSRCIYDMTDIIRNAQQEPLIYWHESVIKIEKTGEMIIPMAIKMPVHTQMEYQTPEETPILIIDLSYKSLIKTLRKMEGNLYGQVMLLNSKGIGFDGSLPQINQSDEFLQKEQLDINHWSIVCVQEKREILKEFYEAQTIISVILLLIVTLFICVANYISLSLTKPLKRLTQMTERMQRQDYSQEINVSGKDEIADLGNAFNTLEKELQEYSRIVEEDKQIIRKEEAAKRKIEMHLLQAQINPHFLYNTLDSMYWYTQEGKKTQVSEIIYNFSALLRIGLNKGSEMIPLEQEIKRLESYLRIQKIIFEDKFNYQITCDTSINNYKIVKILLQPLVENCILHGFENMETGGEIEIDIFTQKEELVMQVLDNGCGFDAKTIKENDGKNHSGFALSNVEKRLALHYGEHAKITYNRTWHGMTKVEIRILASELTQEQENV